jgi:hypothetical protein
MAANNILRRLLHAQISGNRKYRKTDREIRKSLNFSERQAGKCLESGSMT